MANLLNHEDLKKLHSFIEFVSANPTILNMPQLEFVKKFIEKFGGKVPAGDFKMPGGGKCPFGGDSSDDEGVKAEPKAAEAEAADEVEMDSDPESEVELDMEAETFRDYKALDHDNQNVANTIFLKEEPRKTGRCRKAETKMKPKKGRLASSDEEFHTYECEAELNMHENAEEEDDPIKLSAVEVIVKTELEESDEDEPLLKRMDKNDESEYEQNSSELDSDDDEVYEFNEDLHTKSRHTNLKKPRPKFTQSPKATGSIKKEFREPKLRKSKKFKPIVCVDSCTLKCRENIIQNQRRQLREEFHGLEHEAQKHYILQLVEISSRKKIRLSTKKVPRGFRSRYFLPGHKGDRHRVCIKFFLSALSINNNFVKVTLENSHARRKLPDQQLDSNKTTTENECFKKKDQTNISVGNDSIREDTVKTIEITVTESAPQVKRGKNLKDKTYSSNAPKKIERVPKPSRCEKVSCLMNCTTHFTEKQRSQMCATFWSLDYKRRKDFLLSKTETKPLQSITAPEYRKTNKAQRAYQNFYYLRGANGSNVRVCLRYFLATLCISRKVIQEAIKNVDQQTGLYGGEDKRRIKKKKITEDMIDKVKRHIETYPTWVPHKSSKTRYLDSSLSISHMYRQYKEKCDQQQLKTVSNAFYYDIFHNHYQLEFLKRTNKHPTRLQPCRRKPKASDDSTPPKPKKININISEYKGDEPGGYWMPAVYSEPSSTTNKNPSVQIQENVQLQKSYYTDTPYMLPKVRVSSEQQIHQAPQQQSDVLVSLPYNDYSDYPQHPGFFRML